MGRLCNDRVLSLCTCNLKCSRGHPETWDGRPMKVSGKNMLMVKYVYQGGHLDKAKYIVNSTEVQFSLDISSPLFFQQ